MTNATVLAQGNTDATPNEGQGVAGPTGPVPRTTNSAAVSYTHLTLPTTPYV